MSGYAHGYSPSEQERLVAQARFHVPWLYPWLKLGPKGRAVEIGCGVGAQLKLLCERFPGWTFHGIDHSETQLDQARRLLAPELGAGRVTLSLASGRSLPLADASVDAVLLFWVLEHVPEPLPLLGEARRVLAPNGSLHATEVFMQSLYTQPHCAAFHALWEAFTAYQTGLGGDPLVGPKLGGYLARAGFASVEIQTVTFRLDAAVRDPAERTAFLDYWQALFAGGVPGLKAAGRVDDTLLAGVEADFTRLRTDPEAIFWANAVQARSTP